MGRRSPLPSFAAVLKEDSLCEAPLLTVCTVSPLATRQSEAWSAMELAMQAENENMGPCSKGPESLKSGPSEHKDRKAALFCQG